MRNIIYKIGMIMLVVLLFEGCNDQYDSSKEYSPSTSLRYLHLSKTLFEYESSTTHQTNFTVESMDTEWEFSNTTDWISLSPATGKETATVTMDIQENPSGEESRIGLFEFRSLETDWMYSKTLTVSQMASTPYLTIDTKPLYFGGGSGQQELSVISNCSWSASSSATWIEVKKDATNGKILISVSPNSGKYYRMGTVTIHYKNSSKNIDVYQYLSTITTSDVSLVFENVASELSLSLTADADWTSSVSDSWISVVPSTGLAGTHNVKIAVTPNTSVSSRKGYVSFLISGYQRVQIEIKQKGLYIDTDVKVLEFASKKESLFLEVVSNTSWIMESYPEWISLSALNGSGNGTVKVTANDNPSVDSRSGEIVIAQEGLNISHVVEVVQTGKTFYLSGSYMEFPHYASTQSLQLKSELPWTSFVAGEWISTNLQSGNTDSEITVAVLENNSYDERDGNLTYMVDGKSSVVSVHQQSKYFTINDKVFRLTSKGGNVNISFSTNEKWNAIIEDKLDWLLLSAISGEGDGNITLSVSDNPSVNSRSAMVIINTGTGHTYQIPVSQAARYLKVDTQSLMYFAHGGSQSVHVDSDGDYKVTLSDSWISTDNNTTNGIVKVTTTMNQEEQSRRGNITIEMTDLTDGTLAISIPVIQLGQGATFTKGNYTNDKNWNVSAEHDFELSIKGFATDKDWNSTMNRSVSIIKTGYKGEQNWNSSSDKTGEISKDDFGNDTNWDTLSEQSVDIGKTNYEDDRNWNSTSNQSVTISKTAYGDDKNWNN